MTNKPMLSVELDSIALEALKAARQFIANGIELGFISMPEPETPDPAHDTLPMIDRAIAELKAAQHQGGVTLEQVLKAYDYANSHPHKYLRGTTNWCAAVAHALNVQHPATVADHPQCEECKGWGYHENHHEGGGAECGECSGSGKAPVEKFSGDTVVCRRYQLEQHPGQNFYHYDLEPVYGSVPVTVSELITMVESAPVAVVMPEPYGLAMFKMLSGFDSVTPEQFNLVWTACRKEVARLNGVKP